MVRTLLSAVLFAGCATNVSLYAESGQMGMAALLVAAGLLIASLRQDSKDQPAIAILPTSVPGASTCCDANSYYRFYEPRSVPKFATSGMPARPAQAETTTALYAGYVPDGMSPEQYKKLKEKEKAKTDLGKVGARGYKSRSFQSFQEALERGEASHLMPVDPRKVKSGEIPIEEVPYMQRGGAWDGSDVKGMARIRAQIKQAQFKATGGKKGAYTAGNWLKSDKEYAAGGERRAQSVSIFGGSSLPWQSNDKNKDKNEKMTDAEMWKYAGAVNMSSKSKKSGSGSKGAAPEEKKKGWFGF